jgi:chorismate-pyruvate lyase
MSDSLIYPLDRFLSMNGTMPEAEEISAEEIPSPYRELLAHSKDMTPTLEKFHEDTIHVCQLDSQQSAHDYWRMVLLLRDRDDRAVEFGAIHIRWEALPETARLQVICGRSPLGTILRKYKVAHRCNPVAFYRFSSAPEIHKLFASPPTEVLYGRKSRLYRPDQTTIAEVIEILPLEKSPS